MRRLIIPPLLALGACATAPVLPTPPVTGVCNAAPVQRYVGQVATQDVGSRILVESGSRTLRWIPKGMMVTMEFNEARVSIHLDAGNRMTSIACG